MRPAQRDELLIRLDERVADIHRRLDALPCRQCTALAALLALFGKRSAIGAAAIAVVLTTALALIASR